MPLLPEVRAELRAFWRDFSGWVRATSRDVAGETRQVLRELDAEDSVDEPGWFRRQWRRFRRTPAFVQVAVALVLFGGWAYVLFAA